MKPVEISNTGGETFTDYLCELEVNYDSDMQDDFDDLRFADKNAFPLTYWIAKRVIADTAQVYVRIPELPSYTITTIFMFYANANASDNSNESLVTWQKLNTEDIRVSVTGSTEGAWDPNIAFGNEKFLAAWEEGQGPESSPGQTHRYLARGIHGRLYNSNGGGPSPPPPDDIEISDISASKHAENPSIAFSEHSEYYFVSYEENSVLYNWRVYIMGVLVTGTGNVLTPFTICEPAGGPFQYYPCFDPCITYDSSSELFFVVWSKSDTSWNYDVFGKYYNKNGGMVGSQVTIASGTKYQGQPWVCSDNQGHFFVVYEEGVNYADGPFDLKAKMYDSNGNQIGDTILVATATTDVDHVYPSVSYNSNSQNYLVSWNTGDISDSDFNGKINGKLYNNNGDFQYEIVIQSGYIYKIAQSVPYLGSMFFVAYDDDYLDFNHIWGKLVTSDGIAMESKQQLSDSINCEKEWVNLACSGSNIFAVWEDDRLLNNPPTEIRGCVWHSPENAGSANITSAFGNEKQLIVEAVVTSVAIAPEDLIEWNEFFVLFSTNSTNDIDFSILDENGTVVLLDHISSGEDLTNITQSVIRLKAWLTRETPKNSPVLDWWSVTATVGTDIEPPWTEMTMDPEIPNGDNGWFTVPIEITFQAYDNDSPPENVSTYYIINGGEPQLYVPGSIIILSFEGEANWIEYWSIDNASNEEQPHHVVENLKIDLTEPFVRIDKPPDLVFAGEVQIDGSVIEYTSGSGIVQIIIKINSETVFDVVYSNEYNLTFTHMFNASYGELYDIQIISYDAAGNIGQDRKEVLCSDKGIYEPGFIYLFDNPKIGPSNFLIWLDMCITVDYDTLYIVIPEVHENASYADFIAEKIIMGNVIVRRDTNCSDRCAINMNLPLGLYNITAEIYDSNDVLLETYEVISQMLLLLL